MVLKRTYIYIYVAVILLAAVFVIGSAVNTSGKTGLLHIKASDSSAYISISSVNSQAAIIGRGRADIRLPSGDYYLVASTPGHQASATVTIEKGRVSRSNLNLNKLPAIRSVDNVQFDNLGALLNNGISTDQIILFKQYVFNYSPNTQVVSVDSSSIHPGAHNPNVDVGFTTNFNLRVDSKSLNASIKYADSSSLQLLLYDAQNNLLFDSSKTAHLPL